MPEINRMAKHEHLFMQDGARAHTAKVTLEMLKDKKQLDYSSPITGHRIVQT